MNHIREPYTKQWKPFFSWTHRAFTKLTVFKVIKLDSTQVESCWDYSLVRVEITPTHPTHDKALSTVPLQCLLASPSLLHFYCAAGSKCSTFSHLGCWDRQQWPLFSSTALFQSTLYPAASDLSNIWKWAFLSY